MVKIDIVRNSINLSFFVTFFFFAFSLKLYAQFLPSDLPNLKLWLKSDSLVLNGSTVSQWTDISGNNNHIIQTDVLKQPTIINNQLNGYPVVHFDGVNDNLNAIFSQSYNNELTVFIVMRNNAANPVFIYDGGTNYLSMIYVGNKLYIQSGTPNMYYTKTAPFPFSIFQNEYGSTLSKIYENGILKLSGGLPVPVLNGFTLGTRYLQDTYFLNGDVAEIFIYNSILNSSEKVLVEQYLRNRYSPDFSLGNDIYQTNFCPITLTAPSGFTNLQWNTGSNSNTISVNSTGDYIVSGNDNFGFTNYDTIHVEFPLIESFVDTNICYNESAIWDPNLNGAFNYLWSDNTTTPTLTISNEGQYFVKVTDSLGCFHYSDTLDFVIDDYSLVASLGNDTTFCSGNFIELVSNASETVSYEWQGNTSIGQSPTYQISTTGDYWLESTNINGCVAQDTLHAIVSGTAPTVIFNGQNSCLGIGNTFTDGSSGIVGDPVISWSWDFGDGIGVSSLQNPTYSYSAPGIYSVELYALSQGGCGAYYTEQVEVYSLPTASYSYTGHCTDQVMQFTNQSIVGGAAINQYAWNFGQPSLGAMNVSAVQNPYRSFPTGGTYSMTLTVTDAHLCVDDTIMQIVVNATPIIDVFAADACQNEQVQFTNSTIVETPALYFWTFGDNTTSILPLPTKQYPTEGVKTITVKVTAANGCFTSDTIQMTVHAVPVASFDLGPHCKGAYTEVQSTSTISSGTIADLFWVVNLTDTLYGDTTGYDIASINQQQIQLFVTSDFGCSDEQNLFFDPEGAISAAFTVPSTVVACSDSVAFTNTSLGATNYSWSLGNDSTSTAVNPATTYDCSYQDSTLVIQLIASNSLGCIDTAYAAVFIGEYAIDLQVDNIYFQANGTNAILGAELKNLGTSPLTTIDLDVFSETGFVLHEVWTGTLLPNQTEIYVFSNQPAMTMNSEDDVISYYCIRGTGYSNTEAETDYSNNEVCKNIENSEVVLKPLYPNPTGSTITMGIIVPQSSEVAADLVDDQGRVVKQLIYPFTLESGEYTYVFDLSSTANGTYALRFIVDGKTELHRLVVLH